MAIFFLLGYVVLSPLAGALSIPLFLTDGSTFPGRYQIIFIAAGVILLSILVGIISLPFLLKGIKATDKEADKMKYVMPRKSWQKSLLLASIRWKSV